MRDDINSLPIPASAKRYARMKGPSWLGPKKVKLHTAVSSELAGESPSEKMRSKDVVGKVPHTFKESEEEDDDITSKSMLNQPSEDYKPVFFDIAKKTDFEGEPYYEIQVPSPTGRYSNFLFGWDGEELMKRLELLAGSRNYPKGATYDTDFGRYVVIDRKLVKIS